MYMFKSFKKTLLVFIAIVMLIPINTIYANENDIRVGAVTGGLFDVYVKSDNSNATIEYYNLTSDLPVALDSGKIDAYVVDEPIGKMLCNTNPGHYISKKLTFDDYGIALTKGQDELLNQLTEYINKLINSGELTEKQDLWLGADESKKIVDFDSIKNNSPKLVLATTSSMQPFNYIKDGQFAGYEIDLIVSFCKEYGYGLEIEDSNFSGALAAVSTGKANFGTFAISITDERKEIVDFSPCIYEGGVVLVKKEKEQTEYIESFNDLDGMNVAMQAGFAYSEYLAEKVKEPNVMYFNLISDMTVALDSNKISGFVVDKPVADYFLSENGDKYKILGDLASVSYGIGFPKSNPNSEKYCSEFNDFIKELKILGNMNELYEKWTGKDESAKVIDTELTGENGTLIFATSSSTGAPFCYVKNDQVIGLDVDIVYQFAKKYGYDIILEDYSFSGLMTALPLGKCDLGASGICITSERKNTILFPEPYLESSCVVIVKKMVDDHTIKNNYGDSILGKLIESINKTFIYEDRYKLFIAGIGTTILITVLSILIGTILGFVVYMLYRNLPKLGQVLLDMFGNFIQKTPVVVILMIFYYIIFDGANMNGRVVSIIGLSILFAVEVMGLLKMGVNSIDKGQFEAAYTLGYSKNSAFIKIIFPQAVLNVIAGYKSAVISIIKDSAIVGYIAVQDLTKVSDIIRSRTYEAFFPIIVTAIVYYLIASLFAILIRKIELDIDPKRRKEIPILKGVKINDKD